MPARTPIRSATPRFREPSPDAAQPAWDAIPAPMRVEPITIGLIQRDERVNTRPVDVTWVAKKAEDFHPEALGKPIVSRRGDGTIVVIDGQNRLALCRKVEWEGWGGDGRIECEVHENLSLIEEAGLFSLLAGHRSFTAMSKFLARQTQEEPQAVFITEVVERNGYQLGMKQGGDTITAVSTLDKIWRTDQRRHPDVGDPRKLTVLSDTLLTIVKAWPYAEGSTDQAIIDGVGMLFLAYGDDLLAGAPERDLLVRVLAEYPGGPKMLKTNGDGARNTNGGTIGKGVAFTIGQAYDKQQKKFTRKLDFR